MDYEFSLKFKLAASDHDHDATMLRLAEAGCTDALAGFGMPGYVNLEFVREANSAEEAILSAVSDSRAGLPGAQLVEAGPDFVGLTDVADLLGMSRQNMRKLFVGHHAFPPPLHSGTSSVWHLAQVLRFLQARKYEVAPEILEVAVTSMRVNASLQMAERDKRLESRLRRAVA